MSSIQRTLSAAKQANNASPKLSFVDFRWSVKEDNKVGQTTSCSQCTIDTNGRIGSWMIVFVCRKNKMSCTNSVKILSNTLSISSKIQNQMARIITIIKDMESLNLEEELKQLNRLLYRSMDNLMEFELSLRQLKDEKSSRSMQ